MSKLNIYALCALIINYLFSLYERVIKQTDIYTFFIFITLILIIGIISLRKSKTSEINGEKLRPEDNSERLSSGDNGERLRS